MIIVHKYRSQAFLLEIVSSLVIYVGIEMLFSSLSLRLTLNVGGGVFLCLIEYRVGDAWYLFARAGDMICSSELGVIFN